MKLTGPHQQVFYLKFNDPANQRALWLRFTILITQNGFKQIGETWAVFFRRDAATQEVEKTAIKQIFPIEQVSISAEEIRIGDNLLTTTTTRGTIQSKGKAIHWDLTLNEENPIEFDLIPAAFRKSGIVRNSAKTTSEMLRFSGLVIVNGVRYEFAGAPGMRAHLSGSRNGHSWAWGHCNSFVNEQGRTTPFIFEGLTARAWLPGGFPSPKISSFYFFYQEKHYRFNSFWNSLRSHSKYNQNEWTFRADHENISFIGKARAELKDFAGLTYEDTDSSLLYCANSKLSDLQILVYRRGKLEATLTANGTAAFEVASRTKNPYIPLLI